MTAIRSNGDAVFLRVYVQPGAKTDTFTGMFDDRIKICLRAPAVKNQANQALIRFIAQQLDLPKRDVCLAFGEKGRRKTVCLSNCSKESVKRWLLHYGVG